MLTMFDAHDNINELRVKQRQQRKQSTVRSEAAH